MEMEKNSVESKQYLVFKLEENEYGVDIQKVTTIIEKDMVIARVPKTPSYIKGVINLRGEIIPVIDLHKKFNLQDIVDNENTRIIIVKVEEITVGLIVDAVAEVIKLSEKEIEAVNNFSNDLAMEYILGAGKLEDRIVTLFNLEKLISI